MLRAKRNVPEHRGLDLNAEELLLYDHPGSVYSQMARLALEEKGLAYRRRPMDIMERAEQFEDWYTDLNPRGVVPTLVAGEEVVTETVRILHWLDRRFDEPNLTPEHRAAAMESVMADVMRIRFRVILFANRREPDGSVPVIDRRADILAELKERHPDKAELFDHQLQGVRRIQETLANQSAIEKTVDEARAVVDRLEDALDPGPFVAGESYSLADCVATAALARLRLHGFDVWWNGDERPNVSSYYSRVRLRPSWYAAGVIDTGSERDL